MPSLEAVDAKIERARSELRLLKVEIATFCEERARLIVREDCGGQERWVYRGDSPKAPIQWSVRTGEFAHNLRSSLDHLVWQLVLANGGCPDRNTAFPIQDQSSPKNFKSNLRGVGLIAVEYIKSVQPYHVTVQEYQSDFDRVRIGLAMLHAICNMDKHRHLPIAVTQWTGEFPKSVIRVAYHPMRTRDENATVNHVRLAYEHPDSVVNYELHNGEPVLTTPVQLSGEWRSLEFPVGAFFSELTCPSIDVSRLSVSEALDACISSVEIVVGRLRREIS